MTKRKQAGDPDPLDYRKQIGNIAQALDNNEALSSSQREYLISAFRDISNGRDANVALGVKFRPGQSEKAARARRNMALIMHMVAALIAPPDDIGLEAEPMTLKDACEKLTPIAQRLAGDDDELRYDVEYLLKYWNENKHLHSIWRTASEPGSPYW